MKAKEQTGFRLTFDNVAGALGIIFGIVGLIAYLDQRRSAKEQAAVIGFVKKNMTKEVTASRERLSILS